MKKFTMLAFALLVAVLLAGGYAVNNASAQGPTTSESSSTPTAEAGSAGGLGATGDVNGLRMPGGGPGGPGDRGGRGHGQGINEEVLTLLGLTGPELRAELESGKTLAVIAQEKGKTVDELVDAMVTPLTTRLDEAVANGDLNQEQADYKLDIAREDATNSVEFPIPYSKQGTELTIAASTIGISTDALVTELQADKTLATIATESGETADAVISALTAAHQARTDEAVSLDLITATQAQIANTRYTERVTTMVNNGAPQGGGHHGGGHHGGGDRPVQPDDSVTPDGSVAPEASTAPSI